MSPAVAGAWMERMNGTIGTRQSVSPSVVNKAPRDGGGQEARGEQGMPVPLFIISGVILGVLLGLLRRFRILQGWQCRQRRRHDIDRLTDQFQALFREIDQGKNHRP
jgi:hypothetical protein